jgi:hypothetical protein
MLNPFSSHAQMPALAIISSMITPAILILASGSLVASTLTRLARIVDRARTLIDRRESSRAANDAEGIATYTEMLKDYRRRATLVERALSGFYAAIGFFVATSLTIALDNFMQNLVPWLAVGFTICGVTLLLAGTVALTFETNMAAGTLYRELELMEKGWNKSR